MNRTVDVDGAGSEGALVLWEPGKVHHTVMKHACNTVGSPGLCPKEVGSGWALKEVFGSLLGGMRRKNSQKSFEVIPLDKKVVGFEALSVTAGVEQCDLKHVLSIVLDAGQVRLLNPCPVLAPNIAPNQALLEANLQTRYEDRMEWLPTGACSAIINNVVQSLIGIPWRQAGGVYLLPPASIPVFEQFMEEINADSGACQIVTVKFRLAPSESSFPSVLKAVQVYAEARLSEVEAGLVELGDKEQRQRGKKTRLAVCTEVKAFLDTYEGWLGMSLDDLRNHAQLVEDAVNAHAAVACCI